MQASNDEMRYMFHLNIPEGTENEQIKNVSCSLIQILETANNLGCTSVSIPQLISEGNLNKSAKAYLNEIVRVLEVWISYKLAKDELCLEELNVCCPVVTHHNMFAMLVYKNYKKDEEEWEFNEKISETINEIYILINF